MIATDTDDDIRTMPVVDQPEVDKGFLLRRSAFCLTIKFPKPVILIISPDSKVLFKISKTCSTSSMDSFFENPVAA
jgi:hypothetical protein